MHSLTAGGRSLALPRVIAYCALAFTPLVVYPPALDMYRVPKSVVFQASMLAAAASLALLVLFRPAVAEAFRERRDQVILAAAAVVWAAVVTLASQIPEISHDAPLTVLCYAVAFVLATVTPRRRPFIPLAVIFVPAVINAIVALLQAEGLDVAFVTGVPDRRRVIGLIGNPNWIATYLVLPFDAAVAAALTWRRWWLAATAAILFAAIAATVTVTALIACLVAAVAFVLTARKRMLTALTAAMLLAVVVTGFATDSVRTRLANLTRLSKEQRFVELTSSRIPAFAAALEMFKARPLVGTGPGVFAAEYMTVRLRLNEIHPEWLEVRNVNFQEVHNDHLQLLAEAGLPAFLLFAATLCWIASLSFRRSPSGSADHTSAFVHRFAFPAAASFATLATAQFPLQMVTAAATAAFLGGLCFAWIDEQAG